MSGKGGYVSGDWLSVPANCSLHTYSTVLCYRFTVTVLYVQYMQTNSRRVVVIAC